MKYIRKDFIQMNYIPLEHIKRFRYIVWRLDSYYSWIWSEFRHYEIVNASVTINSTKKIIRIAYKDIGYFWRWEGV